jgi:beta-glucanase (GH16 family)
VAKQISFESIISFINLEFKRTEMRYNKNLAGIISVLLCAMLSFSANAQVTWSGLEPKCPLPGDDWKFSPEYSDEFNGKSLDTAKWYDFNPGWKGRPPGFFSPANVKVKRGSLILTSKTETLKDLPEEYHTFTTAAVKSKNRMLYGYYELRFKPMDSRASSAFWFYAIDPDIWTEIDVFEICGKHPYKEWEYKYFATTHVMKFPGLDSSGVHDNVEWKTPYRLADDFITCALEWNEQVIKWYLNGEVIRTRENSYWHQPLEMNFDSETMPEWFGLPDPKDKAGHFKIDYIRVWQKE